NHAVRNELQLINIAAETLKNNPQESSKYINIIENASHHLEDLVRRFSEKTKPITLCIEETDIHQLVEDVLNSMEKMFTLKNINIAKQCQAGSTIVKCDRVHIEEVLINILYNSIEAMPQGGAINLTIYNKKRFINIDVADNGIGMSKSDMEHILEPFYSTKTAQKNLGLGLTYCFAVMKQHHGSLHITSDKNNGTTVTLSLPQR
ncbi:MAG: sensor histidine kinase, partial [Bacteroidota bacterium]